MTTIVLNGWAASKHAWDLCKFHRDRLFSYVEQLDGLPEAYVRDAADGIIVVGWSMGGSSALRLAIDYPDKIMGLVLIATTPRMMRAENWPGMTERRLAALETGLRMTDGNGFFGIAEGMPNPYMMDDDANLKRGLAYLTDTDLRTPLAELQSQGSLQCPVFIFQSEHDGIVRPENARFLADTFPGATMEMIPGSEHALPVTIPEKIDAAVAKLQNRR